MTTEINDVLLEKWAEGFDQECAAHGVDPVQLIKAANDMKLEKNAKGLWATLAGIGGLGLGGIGTYLGMKGRGTMGSLYDAWQSLDAPSRLMLMGGAGGAAAGGLAGALKPKKDESESRAANMLAGMGIGGAAGVGGGAAYGHGMPALAKLLPSLKPAVYK